MSQFPTMFTDLQPLPLERLGEQSRQAADQIADRGYEVLVGLSENYAKDIINMCLEPAIKEYCPNDYGKRFADLEATKQWLAKERAVFLLVKKDTAARPALVGYGWAGAGTTEHVPGGETTFAIRIGHAGQGQGLAAPYTRLMISGAAVLYGAKNVWLETWQSNGGAVHVYHKVGFTDVDQQPAERPTADGQTIADTRLYMSLPSDFLNP